LIDLAFQGGISTIFAYGQTGSGKTFTISGILEQLADDLFDRESSTNSLKLYATFIQLLGNSASDLLDEDSKVDILEDRFGKVNITGAIEKELQHKDDFLRVLSTATERRSTATTLKNDTSSRSHAVYRIRISNTEYKQAEDGTLFIIDLAGSENAADSQFHDKSRIKETKEVNKSLMCLKDCILNRAKSAADPKSFVHIPFRNSKLSLLLKESFELESHRLCRTVVFANIAPTVIDNAMTLNTLRYVTPIKMGMKNRNKVVPDPKSPANWTNQQLAEWVDGESNGKIRSKNLCPWESGKQFLSLPETEILKRIMEDNPKLGEKKAKDFYLRLWKLLVDARVRERKSKMKKQGKARIGVSRTYPTTEDEEMIAANNATPEIELKVEIDSKIEEKEFLAKLRELKDIKEVKLYTSRVSTEERWQWFHIQLELNDESTADDDSSHSSKKKNSRPLIMCLLELFKMTGVKPLYADYRDIRSDDSLFVTA